MNRADRDTFDRVRKSVSRHWGIELRAGQVRCGRFLLQRVIVEFATGEGKTAAILAPAIQQALQGQHVCIATANDYLSQRDAKFAAPVAADFGLRVSSVSSGLGVSARQQAYRSQLTYGTIREFLFDFLRDKLAATQAQQSLPASAILQPIRQVLICDEADSLLIDDALTPCVVSAKGEPLAGDFRESLQWAEQFSRTLRNGTHFIDVPGGGYALTAAGETLLHQQALPEKLRSLTLTDLMHSVEICLQAARLRESEHYLLLDGQVRLIDESTGRVGEGRMWSRGLQQAVEARHGIEQSAPREAAASFTVQQFVREYQHLSGLTGTARESAKEFHTQYGLNVRCVGEHVRSRRVRWRDRAFTTQPEKLRFALAQIQQVLEQGRAVLVSTRTVAASEEISSLLKSVAIAHVVLNARHEAQEGEIVSQAGQPGRVTVATNMAGRGTDIPLHSQVKSAGGLHVLSMQLQTSRRLDRQLMGRCGRQGDPGSFQQLMSAEDDVLVLAERLGIPGVPMTRAASDAAIRSTLRWAQRQIELRHAEFRHRLCEQQEELVNLLQSLGVDPVTNPLPEE